MKLSLLQNEEFEDIRWKQSPHLITLLILVILGITHFDPDSVCIVLFTNTIY